jgi:hypothetical protein
MYHALKVLGTVESLLLLEEEDIARDRNTANGLAVSSTKREQNVPEACKKCETYGSIHGMPSLEVK